MAKQEHIDVIVAGATKKFRSFGGGQATAGNLIAAALQDNNPQFAAGVDIQEVVNFVLEAERILKQNDFLHGD